MQRGKHRGTTSCLGTCRGVGEPGPGPSWWGCGPHMLGPQAAQPFHMKRPQDMHVGRSPLSGVALEHLCRSLGSPRAQGKGQGACCQGDPRFPMEETEMGQLCSSGLAQWDQELHTKEEGPPAGGGTWCVAVNLRQVWPP